MKSEALLISVEYVRQALDALVHAAHEAEFNPLQSLQIVQDRLLSDDFTFLLIPNSLL